MTRLIPLLFGLIVLGCNDDTSTPADSDECGHIRHSSETDRQAIVNGSETFDKEVVALRDGQILAIGSIMRRRSETRWENHCTGTLIGPDTVLTAAHCTFDRENRRHIDPSELSFALGADVSQPVERFNINAIRAHPSSRIDAEDALHDVALLRLDRDATAAVADLEPLEFNCEALDEASLVGSLVQNVGYGITTTIDPIPPNTLRLWTTEEVTELLDEEFIVDGQGVSSVCRGDSGGPSLRTMPDGQVRIIGTVSWGDASCVDRDHFTRIDGNCAFIEETQQGCREVTEAGSCDQDVASFCEEGWLRAMDCTLEGSTCENIDGRFRCAELQCSGETVDGRCEGNTAIWCENNEIRRESCITRGHECGQNEDGQFRCFDPGPCAGITFVGECDGEDVLWCDGETLKRRHCDQCGQSCGWSDTLSLFDCL